MKKIRTNRGQRPLELISLPSKEIFLACFDKAYDPKRYGRPFTFDDSYWGKLDNNLLWDTLSSIFNGNYIYTNGNKIGHMNHYNSWLKYFGIN